MDARQQRRRPAIAIYELANYQASDVNQCFSCFHLKPSITNVNVDGGSVVSQDDQPLNGQGPEGKANLDVEEAGVLAPGASLIVYQGTQTTSAGGLDTYQAIATADQASVVTTSWGGCEDAQVSSSDMSAENVIFEQMSLQGQTILSAAGDNGSSDCWDGTHASTEELAVDDPASQPDVTGVGGLTVTSLASTSPPSTLSETVWNADQGAGGGGVSQYWPQPTWQSGDGVPVGTKRLVPDLSVMANPATGFLEYNFGFWQPIGGTSIGSPIMAAVVATADQACGGRLGLINPTLYALAAKGQGFNDVTTGRNYLFSSTFPDYKAKAGYDLASGLGSPNPTSFITDLCTIAPSASTSSVVVTPNSPSPDLAFGATATLTVRNSSDAALAYVDPKATATEAGANPTVTALSSWTNANGVISYSVDSSVPGTVALSFSVGATVVATSSITFGSSVSLATTPFLRLGSARGLLANATDAANQQVALGVTSAHTMTAEVGTSTSVTNLSTKFHLTPVDGVPAVSCSNVSCVAAVDVDGGLGVLSNVQTPSHATYDDVAKLSTLASKITSGSLSVVAGAGGSYVDVSYLTSAGQVVLAQWRASTNRFTFTNVTALTHLAKASSGTSLVTTSASQAYIATRVGLNLWLLRAGATSSATNVTISTKYSSSGTNAFVGAPQLIRDTGDHNQLRLLGRTAAGALVIFNATTASPVTLSSFTVVASSGVGAFGFIAGPLSVPSSADDIEYLVGSTVDVAVNGPAWTSLPVSTLTATPLVATSLSNGAVPLIATNGAIDALSV